MAKPRHPHLRKLHADHGDGSAPIYRGPGGAEAIILETTIHAAKPGQGSAKILIETDL